MRPHHTTAPSRCASATCRAEPWQTLAVHALALGLVATLAGMVDDGRPLPARETRLIEENLWRAIRYGLDGKLVDWDRGRRGAGARRPARARRVGAPAGEHWAWAPTWTMSSACCARATAPSVRVARWPRDSPIHELHADAVALANAILDVDRR